MLTRLLVFALFVPSCLCEKHSSSHGGTKARREIDASDSLFVADLRNVTSMSFYCTRGTKDLLIAARTLPITELYFEMPDLQVESYLMLKEFTHLKKVRFEHVMDDEWIDRLKSEMPNVVIDAPYPRSHEAGFAK
jgi:hypothetical protein